MTDSNREKAKKKEIKKWMEEKLDRLIEYSYSDNEFAKQLCEKISVLARGNKQLVDIIKKYAISGSGRYDSITISSDLNFAFIHTYAGAFALSKENTYGDRNNEALEALIDFYSLFSNRKISPKSARNLLATAIKSEDTSEYSQWVQDVLNQRRSRKIPSTKM